MKKLRHFSLISLIALLCVSTALAFHAPPWDTGHNSFSGDPGDDDTDPGDDGPCKSGSPFEIASGNFVHVSQDLFIRTLGADFDVSRTYNSHDMSSGPLGHGWTFTYDQRLVETTDGAQLFIICKQGSGKRERFIRNADGSYTSPNYSSTVLRKLVDGSYTLTNRTGTQRRFDSTLHLSAISDRNGNTLSFSYDATGFPTTMTDGAGRTVSIVKGANGKIDSIVDPANRTLRYVYDSSGNLVGFTDPAGNTTNYSYDIKHNLLTITEPGGAVVQRVTYDTLNRVTSYLEHGGTWTVTYSPALKRTTKRDPSGRLWTFTYNSTGNIVSVVDPLGKTEARTYDGKLNAVTATDKLGNTTSYAYDVNNNMTSAKDPLNNVMQVTYDSGLDVVTSIKYPSGSVAGFEYDTNGNLTKFTDPTNRISTSQYDSRGLRVAFTDSAGNNSRYKFDSSGYLSESTDPSGGVTKMTFDVLGNLTSQTDAAGRVTIFVYDVNNHLTKVTDSLGASTIYSYDARGNLISITDAKLNITGFQYDTFRRLTVVTNPLGQRRSFSYDANGNLVSTTDPNGQTITSTYDALDRLTQKRTPDNTLNYQYDSVGNLTSVSDNDSGLNFTYNALSQLIQVNTVAGSGQAATSIQYSYDAKGNKVAMIDPQGGTTSYQFDNLNRLTRLSNPAGQITTYAYDSISRLTQIALANGNSATAVYDSVNQLTSLTYQLAGGTARVDYTYNAVGKRVSTVDGAGPHSFMYDNFNQLIAATHPGPINPNETFSYDAVGNRTGSHLSAQYTYDAANRLLSDAKFDYVYNANGSLTEKTERSNGAKMSYSYDAENHLIGISLPGGGLVAYRYDGFGRRIEKKVNGVVTRYIYDGESILLEMDAGNAVVARFTQGPGIDDPISMDRGANSYFYVTDGNGSVTQLTDMTGAVVQSYVYDSFGQIKQQNGSITNPFTFTGRELDGESGLYYYRARYMDSFSGRFLQEDPRSFTGSSLNLYTYVKNDPLNLSDPLGLDWLENLSNFSAGFGDSLTFGLTDWVREQMGVNDAVDKCSGYYKAGEYVEVGGEIALTAGAGLLKSAAKGAVRSQVRREAARMTSGIAREGRQLHHINPLFGHPGGAPTLFPTGGLPSWVHSGSWNLQLLDREAHLAAHRALRRQEMVAKGLVNPAMTAGRVGANAARNCDCK